MELNLKYYTGDDQYSDGKIEDKIINYIKKYDNYEDAILKDNSWPVFYHLSNMRKNVISWYPFKKDATILEVGAGMGAITSTLCEKCKNVTSIELSKKRATAILERNKNKKNLEIIVGNFKNIKLNKKYDYILLCGVLEYAALYMDSDNPYVDLLNKLKTLLTPKGKILVAIENRLGLKYFCGANEDHTDIPYDGINGYLSNSKIRTLSKSELDTLASDINMHINYYYMFPDYKFPQLILTDEGFAKVKNNSYIPYYYKQMDLVINERKLFKDIENNNSIPIFANSYFLELSEEKCKKEIEYVKFNFYRKEKYRLNTFLIDNKFYKVANSKESKYQIDSLLNIQNLLDQNGIKYLKSYEEDGKVYTNYSNLTTLEKVLDGYLKNNDVDKIYQIYDKFYNYYKSILGEEIKLDKTVFEKYGVKITKTQKDKLHFYKNGFIDIIPSNILVDDDKYILFDQEWYEENVPIEYLMFRAISYFFDTKSNINKKLRDELYKKYNVNFKLFRELEDRIVENIHDITYSSSFSSFTSFELINVIDKQKYIKKLEVDNSKLTTSLNKLNYNHLVLQEQYNSTKSRLNEIENSKGFKLLNKFYKIKGKIRK